MGGGHQGSGESEEDAAVVCRPALRPVLELHCADASRDQHHRRLGRGGSAEGRPEGDAAPAGVLRRLGHRQARSWFSSCPSPTKCRPPAWWIISTSSCPPASRKTPGCRRRKCGRRTAQWFTTSSLSFASRRSNWFQGQKAGEFFIAPQVKTEGRAGYQRAAQRLSGRLCAGPTGGDSASRPSEADQGRFRHHLPGALHAQRKAGQRPDQTGPGAGEGTSERTGADVIGHQWNIQDSGGRSELSGRCRDSTSERR